MAPRCGCRLISLFERSWFPLLCAANNIDSYRRWDRMKKYRKKHQSVLCLIFSNVGKIAKASVDWARMFGFRSFCSDHTNRTRTSECIEPTPRQLTFCWQRKLNNNIVKWISSRLFGTENEWHWHAEKTKHSFEKRKTLFWCVENHIPEKQFCHDHEGTITAKATLKSSRRKRKWNMRRMPPVHDTDLSRTWCSISFLICQICEITR